MEVRAGNTSRCSGIIPTTHHCSCDACFVRAFLPAMKRSVLRIRVNPNIITVVNPQFAAVIGVDIDITFADPGLAAVPPVHIAVRSPPNGQDVDVGHNGVNTVTILRRNPLVGKALLH